MLVEANKLVHLKLAEEEEQYEDKEHGMNAPIDNVLQLKGSAKKGQQCIDGHIGHRQRRANEGNIRDGQLKDDQLEVGVPEAVVVDLKTIKLLLFISKDTRKC